MKFEDALLETLDLINAKEKTETRLSPTTGRVLAMAWNMSKLANGKKDDLVYLNTNGQFVSIEKSTKEKDNDDQNDTTEKIVKKEKKTPKKKAKKESTEDMKVEDNQ